jgi:hypothetical protein
MDEPRPPRHGWPVGLTRAAWALVAVGSLLRIVGWLHARSLWRDEASLAFNILHRDFASYTHPLALDQAAPIGFLGIEKVVVGLIGDSEQALRLVPLLAGILMLVAAVALVRRHLDPATGLIALALVTIAPRLVYYSSELKQYSSDTLAVVLILLVTSIAVERRFRGWALVAFVALGALPWVSFPAVFVLVGSGLTLCILGAHRRDRSSCCGWCRPDRWATTGTSTTTGSTGSSRCRRAPPTASSCGSTVGPTSAARSPSPRWAPS